MENNILFFDNQIQLDCGDYCICLNMNSKWAGMGNRSFNKLMAEVEKSPVDKKTKLEFIEHINDHLLELKSHYAVLFDKTKSKYSWKKLNKTFDLLNICAFEYHKIERG